MDNWKDTSINWLKTNVFEIENQPGTADEKSAKIINLFGIVCGAVAAQPIPFADIFVLTPIQIYMGTRLAAIRGINLSEQEIGTLVKQIGATVGLGVIAQQTAIGILKFVPYLGILTTIPMVYGLTYAIGFVMDEYFKRKEADEPPPTSEEINAKFKQMMAEGKEIGKAEAKKISKKSKDIFKKN